METVGSTTFERVRTILTSKYSIESDLVTPPSLLATLGLDSLDLIEFLFEVEDEFSIRVPQDGASALKMTTVQDIVDNIDKVIAEEAASAGNA